MKILMSSIVLAVSLAGIANAEVYNLPNGVTGKFSTPTQAEVDKLLQSLRYPILSQRHSTIDWLTIEEYDADQLVQELIAKNWGPLTNRAVKVEGANVSEGTLNLAVRVGGGDGLHDFRLQITECESEHSCTLKLTHLSNDIAEADKIIFLSYSLSELGLDSFAKKSNLSPLDLTKDHFLEYNLSIEGEKEFWQPEEISNPVFELKL